MLSSYAIRGKQMYDPVLMEWLRAGLEQVVATGTARRLQSLPQPLAAKTGTSDSQRDAWLAGFDNRHLGVIWVGRDDNDPMPFTGSSAALPVWEQTFRKAGAEPLSAPRGLKMMTVDPQGTLLADGCSGEAYPFPVSWLDKPRQACNSGTSRIGKEIRSWLDWLF